MTLTEALGVGSFPPRWYCGSWSSLHGWTHIISDLVTWGAYTAIPIILVYFVRRRTDLPFPGIFFLFAAFILSCGTVHLVEAVIFWYPVYRLAAFIKATTAIVSTATVIALLPILPKVLSLRSPEELEREILERKEAEKKLQQALLELQAAQSKNIQGERLKALGQMASGIAHNISNALVPATSFCDSLELDLEGSRQLKKLTLIKTSLTDAAATVQRLLDLSRIDSHGIQILELNSLASEVVTFFKDRPKPDGQPYHKMELHPHPEPVRIAANQTLIREALTNLILNALDALPAKDGRIKINVQASPSTATISVEDNGRGMTPEILENCRQPFFTTKGTDGTGLGLTTVWKTVEICNGEMLIESEPGQGSRFSLLFPLEQRPAEETSTDFIAPAIHRALSILLVEDHAGVAAAIKESLSIDQHCVQIANSAEEALQRLQNSSIYDLIITDHSMGGADGLQFSDQVRRMGIETPIILLSGYINFLEKEALQRVNAVLPKPANILELREAITKALLRP